MKHLLLSLSLAFALAPVSAQLCVEGTQVAVLDVNKVVAPLDNGGAFFSDKGFNDDETNLYRVEHDDDPATRPSMIFSGALWLVGLDPGGSIKVAANNFGTSRRSDYIPGPLQADGTTDSLTCAKWDRLFPVNQEDIEALRADLAADGEIDGPVPIELLGWPGRGNPHFATVHGFSLPDQDLAPFIDYDGDGAYDPELGDFPLIKGDKAFWWVFSDVGPHPASSTPTPTQMEVQMMAYATADPESVIDFTTFFEVKCINRGQEDFLDSYVGLWTYPDVGCVGDDAFRSNPDYDLVFTYNEGPIDLQDCRFDEEVYAPEYAPVQAIKVVGSAQEELTEPAGLFSFIAYDGGVCDGPAGQYSPSSPLQYYNTIRGIWIDGMPIQVGGRGYDMLGDPPLPTTKFLFNDLEVPGGEPWISGRVVCLDNQVLSVGPYDLKPGAFSLTTFAAYSTFGLPFDTLGVPNFDTVYTDATKVQEYFDTKTDECLALIRDLTATSVTDGQPTELLVASFPNPVTHTLHLRAVAQNSFSTVRIFSASGQLVWEISTLTSEADIDVSDLPVGLYLARIGFAEGRTEVHRFIKGNK
jgi:hypothetical protein